MKRSMVVAVLVVGIATGTSACTPATPMPVPTPSADASASATPAPVQYYPNGGAYDNLAYFNLVNNSLLASKSNPDGRAFIDNLINSGFLKKDMEVTPDKTAIGLNRDNIQFSVKFREQCIIGQFGNVGYHSVVAPVLETGKCLLGVTRAIDWRPGA